mmetsp:Transcript_53476/g.48086  ORF Transcript_53476/g.48086 Transcript_53476/m.48086 type:complete len:244 (-) Transcript_53476:334-1065(-)
MARLLRRLSRKSNDTNSDNSSDTENRASLIHKIKILTIGDSGVGKSSVILRFTDDTFTPSFITTIGIDYKMKNMTLDDGTKCKCQIWDTAGQERFRNITTAYYRGAQGILLVYDITDEQSFLNVKYWLQQIDQYSTAHPIVILIGNKCDLEVDREVSIERGQELAKDFDILFLETSARKSINIEQCFDNLIKEVIEVQESKCLLLKKEDQEKNIKLDSEKFSININDKFAKVKEKINCNGCGR